MNNWFLRVTPETNALLIRRRRSILSFLRQYLGDLESNRASTGLYGSLRDTGTSFTFPSSIENPFMTGCVRFMRETMTYTASG